jgi:gliding motility-associated-like protein
MKKLYLFIFCAVLLLNNEANAQCPTATFTSTAPQCIGSTVDFTYTGVVTGGTNITYEWDFGAGATPATSTAQSPKGVVYSSSGNKTVTLNVRYTGIGGFGGCANNVTTNTQTITINATPTASFTSTAPQCTGLAVDFTNTGTSAGVTWAWDFGTGASPTTSALQSPKGVVYSSSGSKVVTLTIKNTTTNCTSTASQTININQTPKVSFSNNAPQCVNAAVTFSNTANNGGIDTTLIYNWNFGVGAIPSSSTTENPSGIIYSSSGKKSVTFQITNTKGCSNSIVQNLTILATPTADFASTAPKCTQDTVEFTNNSIDSAGASYSWDFGSGATPANSSAKNMLKPTGVIYSTAGSKIITLIVTNANSKSCADTITKTININQTPSVDFATIYANPNQCVNSAVTYSNTGSTGATLSYAWDFGNNASPGLSTAESPIGILYSSSGSKTVTFKITSTDGCSNSVTKTITIAATPVADFTSTAPKCTLDTVEFTNTGTQSGVNYSWNLGTGATPLTSASQNLLKPLTGIIYATSGTKTITLITTNPLTSCADTVSKTININQTPSVNFATIYANSNKCVNAAVSYTNTGSTGVTLSYAWDFGNDASSKTSTAENPSGIKYASSGSKNVTFKITSSEGCSNSITKATTIAATPVADFTSTAPKCTKDTVEFTNTGTTSGVSYSWNLGTGAAPAASVSSSLLKPANGVMYSTSGTKTVTLITTNNSTFCADTIVKTININLTPNAKFISSTFPSATTQCVGTGINFVNSGGSTGGLWSYSWDLGADATPKSSISENPSSIVYFSGGTKTVTFTVYDAYCSMTSTQTISINALPVANAGKDTIICANTTVTIGTPAIGSDSYNWFPLSTLKFTGGNKAQPTAAPVAPVTQYVVTVTNPTTHCANTDTINVTMLAPLVANAGVDVQICRYDSIQIGAALVKGQNYVWSPIIGLSNKNSPNPMTSPDSTITYTLTVTGNILTTSVSCPAVTDQVLVTVHQLPIANAGPDDTITVGSSTQLVATGGLQYEWRPPYALSNIGINTPIANPEFTTEYIVQVIDIYGCKKEDSVLITVIKPSVWVPNAFTPNGDGKSDIFIVRGDGIKDFEFGVFNRWGEQIFYTKDMATGWDGNRPVTGENLPAGAYVYYVKGIKTDGEVVNMKGMVNLVR